MSFFVGVAIGGIVGLGAGIVLAFWSCAREIDILDSLLRKSAVDLHELNGVIQTQEKQLANLEGYLVVDGHAKHESRTSRF